jgi:protein TonB
LHPYAGIIQADIQQTLTKNEKTRRGTYNVGVKLWIAAPGTVQRAELFRGSGDRDKDVAISQVLEGLVVSQAPPAHTPRPVIVIITVRPL